MRILFILVFLIAIVPQAQAASDKFNFLLYFYDLNAEALAYQSKCLPPGEDVNETFLRTDRIVTEALIEEAIWGNPQVSPTVIRSEILERRKDLRRQLARQQLLNDCTSPFAARARGHYEEMSGHSADDIRTFIASHGG